MNFKPTTLFTKEKIQEMISKAEMTFNGRRDSTSFPFKHKNFTLKLKGSSFFPERLRALVDTFPPVWEFEPTHFSIDFHPLTGEYRLLLSGTIIRGGKLSFALGELTFDSLTIYNSCELRSEFSSTFH